LTEADFDNVERVAGLVRAHLALVAQLAALPAPLRWHVKAPEDPQALSLWVAPPEGPPGPVERLVAPLVASPNAPNTAAPHGCVPRL
jgi:hypothetical protein